jgi:hypothetical protein
MALESLSLAGPGEAEPGFEMATPEPIPPKRQRSRPLPREVRWPPYEMETLFQWIDSHHARTGQWPRQDSGPIFESPREKWANVDAALRLGLRGLDGGSSLARLLDRYRGVRNRKDLPPFTEAQILFWADDYHQHHERWPTGDSGPVEGAPGETWTAVDVALTKGLRGLRGGGSLAQLLARERGVRNRGDLPPLDEATVLAWAEATYRATGRWPITESGAVAGAPGETWCAIDQSLKKGSRGLEGGSSLARLLQERCGVPHRLNQPDLTLAQVLGWADAYHAEHGRWPRSDAGPIAGAPGESWDAINRALREGRRGLPPGTTLVQLLAEHRKAPARKRKPLLTEEWVLRQADAHHRRTGRWPRSSSGPIEGALNETWEGVDQALQKGTRGLPGGVSLPRLLAARRGVPHRDDRPAFTVAQILAWIDAYHGRTGRWPTAAAGAVEEAPGVTWEQVDRALRRGCRGSEASSLAKLLGEQRGVSKNRPLRPLSVEQLLAWIDAHHLRTGEWPHRTSGPVEGVLGENWAALDEALQSGGRGLSGGTTLLRLLAEHRGVPHPKDRPEFSARQILAWADTFRARQGRWPRVLDGMIEEAPGENWLGVENALRLGLRGLPGGSSLHKLIRKHRTI